MVLQGAGHQGGLESVVGEIFGVLQSIHGVHPDVLSFTYAMYSFSSNVASPRVEDGLNLCFFDRYFLIPCFLYFLLCCFPLFFLCIIFLDTLTCLLSSTLGSI
jgi:hypothetical protein